MAKATALVLMYLLFFGVAVEAGGLDDELPSLEGLVRYGCIVKGPIQQVDHGDPGGKFRLVWSVTFWAEHDTPVKPKADKDWKVLYSYRTQRLKALVDCDKFLERVRKAAQEQLEARR